MARILIIGGGCRGRTLAGALTAEGHAVRITTRSEDNRDAIETAGAQCWIGDPDRIASLRLALDGVTVVCWLLAGARGDPDQVLALHDSRLRFMLGQLIDTTVRGLVYEARGAAGEDVLARGEALAREQCTLNSIPLVVLRADPGEAQGWGAAALQAIHSLLGVAPMPRAHH